MPLKTNKDIKRDRDQLDRHEKHAEIIGRRGEHHSRQCENDERIILGHTGAQSLGKIDGEHEHENSRDQKEAFKKQRQAVDLVARIEKRLGTFVDERRVSITETE